MPTSSKKPAYPSAYTLKQTAHLSGLSMARLSRWEREGTYEPQYESGLYSFRDLVGLRTLYVLAEDRGIPVQTLNRFGRWLREHYDEPWATMRFATAGKEVLVYDRDGRLLSGRQPGQFADVVDFPLDKIEASLASAAEQLKDRKPEEIGQVATTRGVCGGQPRIAGTRIPTKLIWSLVRGGMSPEAICAEYPSLVEADIEAAIRREEEAA